MYFMVLYYNHDDISIHALREEGDRMPARRSPKGKRISIHALREEGDLASRVSSMFFTISIHALREEGDGVMLRALGNSAISIHALREEGDLPCFCDLSVSQ